MIQWPSAGVADALANATCNAVLSRMGGRVRGSKLTVQLQLATVAGLR